jgi:ribonuclease HI
MELLVYCDGSVTLGAWGKKSEKDTLPRCFAGWWVKRTDGIILKHHSLDLGAGINRSGNYAEYLSVRSALYWLNQNIPNACLTIHSDSQLIINQLSGKFNCFNPQLLIFRDACRKLALTFPVVKYQWIPREQNKVSDALSKCLQSKFEGRMLTDLEVQILAQKYI